MKRKFTGIMLSAAMLASAVCAGGSITASADETNTYYFLAPDKYFKTEAGALNTSVGAYWWEPTEPAKWPGVEMTAAPEIGENVFKIEGVSSEVENIIFNAFVDAGSPADPALLESAYQTVNIGTWGYDEEEAAEAYEGCPVCDSFNGMIYVIDLDYVTTVSEYQPIQTDHGAWFTLDSYKSNKQYYGSYGFDKEPGTDTAYHKGDTVYAVMTVGGLLKDGEPARLGAYNYDITYDPDAVKYLSCTDMTTGGNFIYNPDYPDEVKLSIVAALGVNEDFSGERKPAAAVLFEVLEDTDDLGITGSCSSLSVVSLDGSSMETLIGVNSPDDVYTKLTIDSDFPQYADKLPPIPDDVIKDLEKNNENTESTHRYYGDVDTDMGPDDWNETNNKSVEPKSEKDPGSASEKASTDSASSDSSRVTSPKTGDRCALVIFPVLTALTAAAAMMLSKRRLEE